MVTRLFFAEFHAFALPSLTDRPFLLFEGCVDNLNNRAQAIMTKKGIPMVYTNQGPQTFNRTQLQSVSPLWHALVCYLRFYIFLSAVGIIQKCGGTLPIASCFNETNCFSPHCPPGYEWVVENLIEPVVRKMLVLGI